MIELFFQQDGETRSVEISPETHERLKLYLWKINASLQQVVNLVYERFGDVSEELILRYLGRPGQ